MAKLVITGCWAVLADLNGLRVERFSSLLRDHYHNSFYDIYVLTYKGFLLNMVLFYVRRFVLHGSFLKLEILLSMYIAAKYCLYAPLCMVLLDLINCVKQFLPFGSFRFQVSL